MKISKLFNVLVVTGASTTVGLAACSSDTTSSGGTTGGTGAAAGASSSAGTTASAGHSGSTSSGGSTSMGGGGATSTGGAAAGSGGASGASGGGSAGTGTAGSGGACNLTANTDACNKPEYLDFGGCCCWIVGPSSGQCTKMGCAKNTPCCAGHVLFGN